MKKVIVFLTVMGAYSFCHGAGAVFEVPFSTQAASGCINVSSTTWTPVPTTPYASRVGLFVTEVSTAAANMAGDFTDVAPTSLTIWPIIFKAGITQFHGAAASSILYMLSLGSAATETVCYREIRQQ